MNTLTRLLAFIFLAASLIGMPLVRGGNTELATMSFVLAVCCGLFLASVASLRDFNSERSPRPAAWLPHLLWCLLLVWIGVQIIPLPASSLAALSPSSAVIHDAVESLGTEPYRSISIAPARTLDAFFLTLGFYALYLLTQRLCSDGGWTRSLLVVITLAGLTQAVYGVASAKLGWKLPLLDVDSRISGVANGTFPNRNHFAAYLCLTAGACLALLLGAGRESPHHGRRWRARLRGLIDLVLGGYPLYRLALLAIAIGVVMSASRMGNIAFGLGLSAAAVLWLLSTRRAGGFVTGLVFFVGVGLVDIAIISGYFGLDKVVQRIEDTDLAREARPAVYRSALPLLHEYRTTGSGLGTFPLAYQVNRPEGGRRYFDHAHNDYLEFTVDLGIPGVLLLGSLVLTHVLFALQGLRRQRTRHRALAVGLLLAFAASLSHAALEFNFQIPAYAATFVVMMAMSTTLPRRRPRPASSIPGH